MQTSSRRAPSWPFLWPGMRACSPDLGRARPSAQNAPQSAMFLVKLANAIHVVTSERRSTVAKLLHSDKQFEVMKKQMVM